MVKALNPDALIVAIGSKPNYPHLKGMDETKIEIQQIVDIFGHPELAKGKTIILGGGATGIEAGIYLASTGADITVIEMCDQLAKAEQDINWRSQLEWILEQSTCKTYVSTKLLELKEKSVLLEKEGKQFSLDADTLILSTGFTPKKEEADSFYGICYHTFKIGDCYKVRKLPQAVNEGYYRALAI
jgi:pyruvate/2-oxoglutarate dehydrogenase complex dihydrolipoamide dehydrogenase (E3) component